MHFVDAKGILTGSGGHYGMNIYRGCTHGCIYCDSRSRCYQFTHAFEDVEVKRNAPELLEKVSALLPVELLEEPSMTAEDFSEYQQVVPGLFFFLGLGDVPSLHSDNFDFDESILLKGADFFEALAEQFQ